MKKILLRDRSFHLPVSRRTLPSPITFAAITIVAIIGCEKPQPNVQSATDRSSAAATTSPTTTQSAGKDQDPEAQLYGVWVAKDVDAKIGQLKIKLTFRHDGPMKLAAWSDVPFVGQVRDKSGPYTVNGDVLSSPAIRGGTTVHFWFDDGHLVIRYEEGKTVRFDRQS